MPSVCFNGTSFVLNNEIYAGTGGTSFSPIVVMSNFWAYDPNTNIWTAIASMPTVGRLNDIAFSIGGIGYCGSGSDSSVTNNLTDFWQYAPTREGTNDMTLLISNVSIYPNPSSGLFKINYNAIKASSLEIKIIDIDGKIIQCQNNKQFEGANEFSFDLSKESKGIYFVELNSENEKSLNKLILI
jgi:hypothetical protein